MKCHATLSASALLIAIATAGWACDTKIRGSAAPPETPIYDDIRKMPTDLDRTIHLFGEGCIELPGRTCSIVKTLAAEFADASRVGSLHDFLANNGFACKVQGNEVTCIHFLRFLDTPPTIYGYKNPDIENTFITKLCFSQKKSKPLTQDQIDINFVRIERQIMY